MSALYNPTSEAGGDTASRRMFGILQISKYGVEGKSYKFRDKK